MVELQETANKENTLVYRKDMGVTSVVLEIPYPLSIINITA